MEFFLARSIFLADRLLRLHHVRCLVSDPVDAAALIGHACVAGKDNDPSAASVLCSFFFLFFFFFFGTFMALGCFAGCYFLLICGGWDRINGRSSLCVLFCLFK
ncbi:hypothetical protein J1N35_025519 [Gossypium stocksii]|uniref:Uncharacterized protein n=1 Tax=Gossypium stocksii TaxID=47602 RepID=A0A9D3V824_9ROSI|nr:hypothetical protein J1N35_025519 [Gossypium stocksii]